MGWIKGSLEASHKLGTFIFPNITTYFPVFYAKSFQNYPSGILSPLQGKYTDLDTIELFSAIPTKRVISSCQNGKKHITVLANVTELDISEGKEKELVDSSGYFI